MVKKPLRRGKFIRDTITGYPAATARLPYYYPTSAHQVDEIKMKREKKKNKRVIPFSFFSFH